MHMKRNVIDTSMKWLIGMDLGWMLQNTTLLLTDHQRKEASSNRSVAVLVHAVQNQVVAK